ncbi:MAG: hypothetical protein V2A58_10460 [Planctomycetota bacterium]
MKADELARCIDAEVLFECARLQDEIEKVYAGDSISDLLTQADEKTLIVSQLVGAALVRAAALVDAPAICFVDRSMPPDQAVRVAKELGVALMVSPIGLRDTHDRVFRHLTKPCGTAS